MATPSRAGKRWTEDEDKLLVDEVYSGKTYSEIAVLHERTDKAIRLRMIDKAIKLLSDNDNLKIEDVAKELRLDVDELSSRMSRKLGLDVNSNEQMKLSQSYEMVKIKGQRVEDVSKELDLPIETIEQHIKVSDILKDMRTSKAVPRNRDDKIIDLLTEIRDLLVGLSTTLNNRS